MGGSAFVIKGSLIDSRDIGSLTCVEDGYLVCENGVSAGVFEALPEQYAALPLTDYSGLLIIPGMTDLHLHAPQFTFAGTGMDLELLEWLKTHAFREEAKYADLDYAARRYRIFTDALARSATTSVCVFATLHTPAALLLMDMLEESGLRAYVGKVNMDRNGGGGLCESTEESVIETERWLAACTGRYSRIKPILTPRFIPSCTNGLLEQLGAIRGKFGLPVQSHLSENRAEVELVRGLHPDCGCYGAAYDKYGLFGGSTPAIMAHCVHSTAEETALMKTRGVYVAHCPQSNTNLCSGIAPVRRFLDEGLRVGLGTDVAGGFSLSMFRAVSDAVQVSKLRWAVVDASLKPLTVPEAFYLATKGGGAFFGKTGSFEAGYSFDVLALDDSCLQNEPGTPLEQRLEKLLYRGDERNITAKYVAGNQIF